MNKNRPMRAIIGCIIMTSASMSAYMTLSNYLVPLSEDIGADIGSLSLMFTFAALSGIVVSLLLGKIFQVSRVRPLMAAAAFSLVAFYAILAFGNSPALLYAGAFLFGIATVLGAFGTCLVVITWWAPENIIGRAISGLTIGMGVLTFISSPLVANGIAAMGRFSALYQGIACGALMLFAALFLISEHPSAYGRAQGEKASAGDAQAAALPGPALSKILKTAPFWLGMIAIVAVNGASTGFTNNAAAFYLTFGVDAVQASYGISVYSVAQLVWSFLFGLIVDKRGLGLSVLVLGLVGAATLVAGTLLSGFAGVCIMGAMVASLSFGGSIGAILFPQLYGPKESGTLIGWANAAASVGAMFGAPVAASLLTSTGSLDAYLYLAAALVVLAAVIVVFASSKKTTKAMQALQ